MTTAHTSYFINNALPSSRSMPPQLSYASKSSTANPYDHYDYLCKLLVIGDSGCGKSSLLKRFADDEFHIGYSSTIGVDFEVRTVDVGQKKVKMQMWDTAGQERFRTITSSYYRGAHAVLIVFDVTNEDSFRNVAKWIAELEAVHSNSAGVGSLNTQILLIANKVDLNKSRVVESHRIEELATELGVPFLETSAKLNTNVHAAFQTIAANFVRHRMTEEKEGRYVIGGPGGKKDVNGVSLEDGSGVSAWQRCMGACSIM